MKDLIEKYVGKKALINCLDAIMVEVTIMDVKERWGRVRYLVSPTVGNGSVWIEHLRIPDLDVQEKEITTVLKRGKLHPYSENCECGDCLYGK